MLQSWVRGRGGPVQKSSLWMKRGQENFHRASDIWTWSRKGSRLSPGDSTSIPEGGSEQRAGPGQRGGWGGGRGQSLKALNDVRRTSQGIFRAIGALESFNAEEPYNTNFFRKITQRAKWWVNCRGEHWQTILETTAQFWLPFYDYCSFFLDLKFSDLSLHVFGPLLIKPKPTSKYEMPPSPAATPSSKLHVPVLPRT